MFPRRGGLQGPKGSKGSLPILLSPRLREGRWCVSTKGGWPVGPAKGKRFLSLTGPLGRRVQRVQRGRIAPQGKRLTGFSGLCRFPTARLSLTHNNLCVALLLQIMFAGVTPVRCAPPSAAMSFICRWRGPPPPACQGEARRYGTCIVPPVLSPSFRAELCAGMNHIISWSQWNGAEKSPSRMLPWGSQFRMECHFATSWPSPPRESMSLDSQVAIAPLRIQFLCHPKGQCYLVKEQAEEDQQN